MTFEFLIACRASPANDLRQVLIDLLAKVLEDNLNEFDVDAVASMVILRHERKGNESPNESGAIIHHILVGFALEIPDGIESTDAVISEFAAALADTPPIFHAVKFEDPLLQTQLAERAAEIYALEMKVRRVLSLVYLHAYQDSDPYDLLCEEAVQPMTKEKPQVEQMRAVCDNQFFHLTFGQYVGLNQRPDVKLPALLEVLQIAKDFQAFRDEILRVPVEHEDDAVLLAGLRQRMDAIERMRNCVAHNRHPSKSTTENYLNARPLLDAMLEQYLARWQVPP